ncbi:MAG: FlgB family protein [Paracoccus sp. (in: a-proteobacteria)]
MEKLETVRMSQAMTAHAVERAKVVAGNVANADTPGYRTRDLPPFPEIYRDNGVNPMRTTRIRHFSTNNTGGISARTIEQQGGRSPNGNSVSLEDEMVRIAEVKRQHEISLAVYRSSLTMLRSAMGRS